MRPLNPDLFIGTAHAFIGLGRHVGAAAGTAGGTLIDDIRREADVAPGDPWDLAFVHHVGWHSHRLRLRPQSAWPFPRTAGHDELASVARSHGLTVERPDEGDIVLHWSGALERHVRAAIVVGLSAESVDAAGCQTFYCVTVGVSAPHRPLITDAQAASALPGGWVRETETPICPQKGDLLVRWALSECRQATFDSRRRGPSPRAAAPWEFDEQLGRCA